MFRIKQILYLFFTSPAHVLFLLLLGALAAINANYLEIGFLPVYAIDEYGFHLSLLDMYDGLQNGDLRKLFGFRFYNYGFGFFLINLIVSLPFLDGNHTALAIYLPRMVTSLCALVGLYYLYRTSRFHVNALAGSLFVILVISMPAFWVNACLFHPDWLMTTCLLAAFYYFVCNDDRPGWNYWYGILWFGLAVGLGKFQAVTFLPFLFFYVFHDEIARLNFSHFTANLKRAVLSVAAVFAIFVVLNPYILHPSGRYAFLRMFNINMLSNATGHGLTIKYDMYEKISNVIFNYYLNPVLFIVFLSLAVFWCIDYFHAGKRRSYQALAFYCIIYLAYLLVFVNKDWQAYYLGLLIPAVLLAVPFCAMVRPTRQILILLVALLSQVAYYGSGYAGIAKLSYRSNTAEHVRQHRIISNYIVQNLKDKIVAGSVVLISPGTGFAYDRLGLHYRNVFLTNGFLSYDMIDVKALSRKYYNSDPELFKIKISGFRTKDFIVLNKADVYFRPEMRKKIYDTSAYDQSIDIIGLLDAGTLGYRKIAENNDVIIYQRIPPLIFDR